MSHTDPFNIIHGLSRGRIEKLLGSKIYYFQDFLSLSDEKLQNLLLTNTIEDVQLIKRNIQLYLNREIVVSNEFYIPSVSEVIFFDLEAKPGIKKEIFLVSFLNNSNNIESFYYQDTEQFYTSIKEYLVSNKARFLVASSGNNWDYNHLKNEINKRKDKSMKNPIKQFKSYDLMKKVSKKIISPVGFSVKALSDYFGYNHAYDPYKDNRLSEVLQDYNEALVRKKTGYIFSQIYAKGKLNHDVEQALIEYNQSDVRSLKFIYEQFFKLAQLGKGIHSINTL
jgi:hypothetical protein